MVYERVIKRGLDETGPSKQRYECKGCGKRFDDLTETIFAGHHQTLEVWILCLYFMGLNLSKEKTPGFRDDPTRWRGSNQLT